MMELKTQHLFTIDSDDWTEVFVIRVVDDLVTIVKDDEEMVLGDLEDAVEAIGLIHKALKGVKNGD
jgi:hypothetical protein